VQYPPQPYGYPAPYPGAPVPPRRPARWLVPVLVGAVLAIVLAAAGGFAVYTRVSGDGGQSPGAAGGNSGSRIPNVDRPGFQDLEESIVDPAPLTEKVDAPPVTVGGAPVVPACSLLSLADLTQAGVRLKPNPLKGGYQRSFFDGKGTGAMEKGSDYTLPISPQNTCEYFGYEGSVSIDVFQESYTSPKAMVEDVERYEPQPAIKGVTVTKQPKTSTSTDGKEYAVFAMRLGKVLARVTLLIEQGKLATVQPKVLDTVAGKLAATPVGNPVIGVDSPAYPMAPLDACAVLAAEDFQALTNVPAAPFAQEEIATAVGRINFSLGTSVKDRNEYAYVETGCRRTTGETTSNDRVSLKLDVRSYTTDKAAANDIAVTGPYDKGQPISRTVGDESYCVTFEYARAAGALVFRSGRHHLVLTLFDPKNPTKGQNPAAMAERLAPIADRIIPRVKQ
jgi:hypothetical protein